MEESVETTEGITRADVDAAMAYLGIFNPKPEIPLELTVSGHDLVGVARRFLRLEYELVELRSALHAAGLSEHLKS